MEKFSLEIFYWVVDILLHMPVGQVNVSDFVHVHEDFLLTYYSADHTVNH